MSSHRAYWRDKVLQCQNEPRLGSNIWRRRGLKEVPQQDCTDIRNWSGSLRLSINPSGNSPLPSVRSLLLQRIERLNHFLLLIKRPPGQVPVGRSSPPPITRNTLNEHDCHPPTTLPCKKGIHHTDQFYFFNVRITLDVIGTRFTDNQHQRTLVYPKRWV